VPPWADKKVGSSKGQRFQAAALNDRELIREEGHENEHCYEMLRKPGLKEHPH